jgi:hypothetical protein
VQSNELAADVIDAILTKNPKLTVMIADCNGKVLTSTLTKRETRENVGNILSFTDKCKVLVIHLKIIFVFSDVISTFSGPTNS